MAYSNGELDEIFDSTNGRCHLCHGAICRCNYGRIDARGAWEVDHSNARAGGGTNRMTNLKPAHIPCNRWKQAKTTRAARAAFGTTRAPMSKEVLEERTLQWMWGLGAAGAVAGTGIGAWIGDATCDDQTSPKIRESRRVIGGLFGGIALGLLGAWAGMSIAAAEAHQQRAA